MKLPIGPTGVVAAAIAGAYPASASAQSICQKIPAEIAWMTRPTAVAGSSPYTYRTVNHTDLRLHVFFPTGPTAPARRAAIVFFFGGGWSWGTVEQFVPQAKYLAGRGMVAAVADYRVLCRDDSTPFESVEDAKEAIRWMRKHATTLGIDPTRIAAGGESAGAHLALSSAVFDSNGEGKHHTSPRPDTLILFSPAIDLTVADIRGFLRERFGDAAASRIGDISPLQHISKGLRLPPTLILNGNADKTTPSAIAEAYCKLSIESGNVCHVVCYEGADHGFANPAGFPSKDSQGGKWYRAALLEVDRFLVSIGYLQGPPPD